MVIQTFNECMWTLGIIGVVTTLFVVGSLIERFLFKDGGSD